MSKGLGLAVGGALLFAIFLAIGNFFGSAAKMPVIVVAVLGIGLIIYLDRGRAAKAKKLADQLVENRFKELSAQAGQGAFELAVTGPSYLVVAIGLVAVGGLALHFGWIAQHYLIILTGIVFLMGGSLLLMRAVPAWGKPVISLTRIGFLTPLTTEVPWKLVNGIYLQTNFYNGQAMSHVLVFRIESLPQLIPQFGLFYRLMHSLARKAGKERIAIVLKGTSERPEIVYRLARLLWTKSTGRDYDWNPNVSAEANDAVRKLKETTDRVASDANSGAPLRSPAEIDKAMKELGSNVAIVQREARKHARTAKWLQIAAIVFAVLYILLKLYGKSK